MSRSVVRGVCRTCHGGCGVFLTLEDDRLISVTGDPDSPFNLGATCEKGRAVPDIVHHPDRLRHPLKRQGKRGGGDWAEISWDQALDEIAGRLDTLRTESGPWSVALGQGTGRHHYLHVVRFANCFGTPNWYEPGLAQCFHPRVTLSRLTYGALPVGDYQGETKPRTILFWGHNPLVSGPDGELSFPIDRALAKGDVFGIAVDPRRSRTARKCKLWLPLRPGTDTALALGMIHVIIAEGLHDHEFVTDWCTGFDRLREHVKDMTPERTEAVTGVPRDDIVLAARTYATRKPGILEWGVGLEQNPDSTNAVRAVAILRAITGNIDVPGGDILGMEILDGYPVHKDYLSPEAVSKRLGREYPLLTGSWALMPSAHIPSLVRAMIEGEPYRVRGLLVFGGNPLTTVAESARVDRALHALDLLVVSDIFMTPTAERADYVLPAALWPEIDQAVGFPILADNGALIQRKAYEMPECRSDEWMLDELAARLNLPGAEERVEDCLNKMLVPLGRTVETEEGGAFMPPHEYRKYLKRGFRTISKKVELYSRVMERLGLAPLPPWPQETVAVGGSAAPKPPSAEFPLQLITGARLRGYFHSEYRQIARLRRRHPEPTAELHPDTAAALGIADGAMIAIVSPHGRITQRARLTGDIRPDVVSVEHGWWFPEEEGPDHGMWRANANVLTSLDGPYDPGFGAYLLRGLPCRVELAGAGE